MMIGIAYRWVVMKLRDLEYLVAVDEMHNFHRAAERCYVSQPTLSGQLKKLEQLLGVQLIERTNRQVMMTEVGRAVAEQARKVLLEVDALRGIVQSFEDPLSGDLQVGMIPTVAPYLLPLVMPPLHAAFPKLKLWLHEHQTHILLDKLRHGELDLLILALPVEGNDFAEIPLFDEPFQLAVPLEHRLAKFDQIKMAHLQGEQLMLLGEGHCLRDHALDVCGAVGATQDNHFHATSLETLRHMVGEGMGITLMPELAVRVTNIGQGIRYLPFCDPLPTRHIGMLYRQSSHRQACFSAIAQQIREIWQQRAGNQ